tara:strand:+ start:344 stop:454 length:111 start_codon:yes stop_codon:yes gene_type:complete
VPDVVESVKLLEKLESSVDTSNPEGAVMLMPEEFEM